MSQLQYHALSPNPRLILSQEFTLIRIFNRFSTFIKRITVIYR
jgi:hypothetical protein